MKERYFVIRWNSSYSSGRQFEVVAFPQTLEAAKDFASEYAKKDTVNSYVIAKSIITVDINVDIKFNEA